MVIISIRARMLIIYTLIAVLSFILIGSVLLDSYKAKRIKNEEIRLFETANIVADTYKANIEDIIFTRTMVKNYAKQANARILVISARRQVLIDNYNTYIGRTVDNKEVRSSIKGESTSRIYNKEGKKILQLSVPITISDGFGTRTAGAVLVSASMDRLTEDIEELRSDIVEISLFSLLVSMVLILIAASSITKPLRDLTYGVNKISSGALGYKIANQSTGEFQKLINTFNKMSHRLSMIEQNRKNFINNISHELRTPITSIKVLAESLMIGETDLDTYKDYMEDIHNEAQRMEQMVGYLLDSIKLEEISLDLNEENIGNILKDASKLITPYARKYGVLVELNIIDNVKVRCDYNRIKEVVLNLIDNSIKYRDTKKTNNYVWISLKEDKDKYFITIEDNGLGIKDEDLPNIFERGFKVSSNYNKEARSQGIGLAIVKSIIDKHKWDILVESIEDVGSVFTIIIPK